MREVKFRGQSGKAYSFVRMAPNAPWAREAGVALFAAQGPFGWRVVRLDDTSRSIARRPTDLGLGRRRTLWCSHCIRVCVRLNQKIVLRRSQDLEAGLNPVLEHTQSELAIAA